MLKANKKPVVIVTGAAGNIGSALVDALKQDYEVAGFDRKECENASASFTCDLTDKNSIDRTIDGVAERFGRKIAAVVHLAAYFDFTGKNSPHYHDVNEEGTRLLLEALQRFKVERFIYSSTMLVHEAHMPGQRINENTPLEPGWAYPESKAKAEEIIARYHGRIPYTILRLAGLYDERTAVPTLAHQIARIFEHDFKSHLYAGDPDAGQAFLHRDDMIDAFVRTVERRNSLPKEGAVLIGENETESYEELQERLGALIHGRAEWDTREVPAGIARAGAWLEEKSEPVVPDSFDHGEKPFIRPFMVDLASDHYALDTRRAQDWLGWTPKHRVLDSLPAMVNFLKSDPLGWYKANGITPPDWVGAADSKGQNPARLRNRYERRFKDAYRHNLWAHFFNIGLGAWLIASPATLGYDSALMGWSDVISGALLMILASLCLSPRFSPVRWGCAFIGCWVLAAPLFFWAPTAAAYLNGTLVGALVIGLSVLTRPPPGISIVAAMTGPTIPPGWDYNPSGWFQRIPIIVLAFFGLFISRYLAAYQLGHIDAVWDPFFTGVAGNGKNGTEEIVTSSVSEAWPVSDAGMGALTYMLEILTGLIGSVRRWRTMPWLVMLFGIMIVPLGAVSITFIIIQPIVIGTWCTLCLIAAAAMLIQIPYSLDELVATSEFLWRRKKAGRPLLRIFFTGDTDEGGWRDVQDNFARSPARIFGETLGGGVNVPWNLALVIGIGVWLMFTRLSLGADGGMANADHLVGSLAITIAVTAFAEVGRFIRLLIVPLGLALVAAPFVYDAGTLSMANSIICGLALALLSFPRGKIRHSYGSFGRWLGYR